MKRLFSTVCRRHIIRNALIVAAVVGTALNLINQGEALFSGNGFSIPHLFMNYLVPYCVASYSAAKNELTRNRE